MGVYEHFFELRICSLDAQVLYECQGSVDGGRGGPSDFDGDGLWFHGTSTSACRATISLAVKSIIAVLAQEFNSLKFLPSYSSL